MRIAFSDSSDNQRSNQPFQFAVSSIDETTGAVNGTLSGMRLISEST